MNKKLFGFIFSFIIASFLLFTGSFGNVALAVNPNIIVDNITPTSADITVTGLDLSGAPYYIFYSSDSSYSSLQKKPITVENDGSAFTTLTGLVPLKGYAVALSDKGDGMRWFTTPRSSIDATITGFTPTSGSVGDTITIAGTDFTNVSGVFFGVTSGPIISYTANQIMVKVPTGATTGKITAVTTNGNPVSTGTFTVVPIINNVKLKAIDPTETSVTLEASGVLNRNSYDFYIYDRTTYYSSTVHSFNALYKETVDILNPIDKTIQVKFNGIKLQQGGFYVGIVSYEGDNDNYPFAEFQVPNDLLSLGSENISILNTTSTTVDLRATGLSEFAIYEVYLENITKGTPPLKKPFSQWATEDHVVSSETISFTGLTPNDSYVASLYNDGKNVARVPFIAKVGSGSAGAGTKTDTTTTEVKDCGLVPCCNTGEIDTGTGQYKTPCNFDYFMRLINGLIKFLLFTIATPLIALIIMYTGYLYITAGGKTGQTEKVRHILFNAVIGYIIALAAWLIINTIITSLNLDPSIETFLK